jgi:hypothetical protein
MVPGQLLSLLPAGSRQYSIETNSPIKFTLSGVKKKIILGTKLSIANISK